MPYFYAARVLVPLAFLSLPAMLLAQTQPAPPVPEIYVSATATVQRSPDFANLRLAVAHRASKAADAARPNAAAARSIIAAITAAGVAPDSVVTAAYSVGPQYAQDRRRIIDYAARTVLLVRGVDIERIGQLLDDALAAGASEIEEITFGVRHLDEARREALTNAVTQLRADASALAAAAGGELGALLRINASNVSLQQPAQNARLRVGVGEAGLPSVPPITPGEIAITVLVSAQFEFVPVSGG